MLQLQGPAAPFGVAALQANGHVMACGVEPRVQYAVPIARPRPAQVHEGAHGIDHLEHLFERLAAQAHDGQMDFAPRLRHL